MALVFLEGIQRGLGNIMSLSLGTLLSFLNHLRTIPGLGPSPLGR